MKKNTNKNFLKGVSLIELLIVISIIAILTGSIIPTINSFNKDQNIKQATENLAADLKTLRDKSLSGAVNPNAGSTPSTAPRVWWGFRCNPGNNKQYDLGYAPANIANPNIPGFFNVQQTKDVAPQQDVTISCIQTIPIYFKRISGELYYSDGVNNGGPTDNVNIVMQSGSNSKTIFIYRSGKIVVQ